MIETTELYGGEIICEFNPARHTYVIVRKGRRYKVPSVTRITSVLDKSGPLIGWAINQTLDVVKGAIAPGTEYAETYLEAVWKAAKGASRQTKQEAADRGKATHRRLEACLRVRDFSGLQDICGENLDPLFAKVQQGIQEVERRLYSRRYRYSGTCDAIARVDGILVLIDWKTGKSIYPEFHLQTAAYVHAYEEEFPDKRIEGRYLVRLAEDGSIEPHYYPRSTLRKDFQAFLGAKALYDRVQTIEKEGRKNKQTM